MALGPGAIEFSPIYVSIMPIIGHAVVHPMGEARVRGRLH
jgi:hypothetical protein